MRCRNYFVVASAAFVPVVPVDVGVDDGVDERQIANALQIGSELADAIGFQYIVTMNSDDLQKAKTVGFDFEKYLLEVKLTDAKEDGGLFGFRF